MTAVGELLVASAVEPWQAIGLHVVDGVARVGGISLRFVPKGMFVVAPAASTPGMARTASSRRSRNASRSGSVG